MNKEQLKKGNLLSQQILQTEYAAATWKKAMSFHATVGCRDKDDQWIEAKTTHLPFNIVKSIVLDAYEKEIAALQKEFDNL